MENKIMGGTSYYPDHWPQSDWERDMTLIKKSGLEIIRFGEFSWYWYEPEEGIFDFSGYDIFMDLAHKLELKVVLCTPTAAAPEWLLHKYPDVRLVDQFGRQNQYGRHMVSYNHPKAKELAQQAIIELAERYKDHPALYGWQIDNEPTAGESGDKNKMYDYHPETVKLFREFMKNKYKSLKALNESWQNNFWSRSFTDWEQIKPPQSPVIPGMWLDWMRFRDYDVVNFIRWQLGILRSVKNSFIIGTNIPECGYGTVILAQDYWEQCKGLDYVGTDLYLHTRDWGESMRNLSFSCDIIRSAASSAGAEFWISETQAGPSRSPWRSTFAPGVWGKEFQRLCVNGYAEHGAEKILFFLWRPTYGGREFGGSGLVDFDGTPNEITNNISVILEESNSKKDKIFERPPVCIHHSRDSLLLARGYDPDDRPWDTIVGWYHCLNDIGYRAEFLSDEMLIQKRWNKGDILVLPYTTVIDDYLSCAIKGAIEKGVIVISGFSTGFFNEFGSIEFHCPGKGLDNYFGVKINHFDVLPNDIATSIQNNNDIVLDELVAYIQVNKGEVLLKDSTDKPLVVKNANVLYFSFDFGSLYKKLDKDKKTVLQNLIHKIFDQTV